MQRSSLFVSGNENFSDTARAQILEWIRNEGDSVQPGEVINGKKLVAMESGGKCVLNFPTNTRPSLGRRVWPRE